MKVANAFAIAHHIISLLCTHYLKDRAGEKMPKGEIGPCSNKGALVSYTPRLGSKFAAPLFLSLHSNENYTHYPNLPHGIF